MREGNALDDVTADRLVGVVDHLTKIWRRKDAGIWELQQNEHYTSSKLSAGTTALTMFRRCASAASIGSPSIISSLAVIRSMLR